MKIDKKMLLIFLLTLAIVAAFIAIFVIERRPTSPPIAVSDQFSHNADQSNSVFGQITYVGQPFAPPTFLPVATAYNDSSTETIILQDLIDFYQLGASQYSDKIWVSQTSDVAIMKDQANCYQLSISDSGGTEPGTWNENSLVAAALNFITSVLGDEAAALQATAIEYLEGQGGSLNLTDRENANVAKIQFNYQLADLPIYYQDQAQAPFTVFINTNEQVFRLDYCAQFLTLTPQEELATLTVEKALQNINSNLGLASIITAEQPDVNLFDITYFPTGELTKVQLEYRIDDNTQLAYPFYRFTGTLFDREQTPVNVELITPAIATAIEQ